MREDLEDLGGIAKRIRDLHTEMGAVPARAVAREAVSRGFWPESTLDGAVVAWAAKQVRNALCQDNPHTGVQHAVAIEKGPKPRWKQTELCTLEDANFTIQDHAGSLIKDYAKLATLHAFFVAKFGAGISSIPRLV